MISATHEVSDEFALDVPGSTNEPGEVLSKILPPYFSKERLFTYTCMKLHENDHLTRTNIYR